MWKPLSEEGVVAGFLNESTWRDSATEARFLSEISSLPWAAELYAVTSLSRMRLTRAESGELDRHFGCILVTTADSHQVKDRYGRILVSCEPIEQISIGYVSPGCRESEAGFTCSPEESAQKLELLLMRLFDETG
jgi:hypothetical protein